MSHPIDIERFAAAFQATDAAREAVQQARSLREDANYIASADSVLRLVITGDEAMYLDEHWYPPNANALGRIAFGTELEFPSINLSTRWPWSNRSDALLEPMIYMPEAPRKKLRALPLSSKINRLTIGVGFVTVRDRLAVVSLSDALEEARDTPGLIFDPRTYRAYEK